MLNLDYVAGLFDSEGWITFTMKANGYIMCNVGISMVEEKMIDALCAQFPGSNKYRKDQNKLGTKPVYMFRLTGLKAEHFVNEMVTRCYIKQPDLEFYFEWLNLSRQTTNKLQSDTIAARKAFIIKYKLFRNR